MCSMPDAVLLPEPKPSKRRPKFATAYSQAKELQRLLMLDARDPEIRPHDRAALARAFCDLEETKRKLRMKPLPKSVDVSKYGKRAAKPASTPNFTE